MGNLLSTKPDYSSIHSNDQEIALQVVDNSVFDEAIATPTQQSKSSLEFPKESDGINDPKLLSITKTLRGKGPPSHFTDRPLPSVSSLRNASKCLAVVLPYFWPTNNSLLRIRVIICVLLLFLSKLVNISVPFFYRSVVNSLDSITPNFNMKLLIGYGVLRVLGQNLSDIRDVVFAPVENYATQSVAVQTFSHCLDLSLSFHLMRNTGAVLRTMERGKNAVTMLFEILGFTVIPTLLEVIMTCIIVFTNFGGWVYAVIIFLTIAGYVIFTCLITEWRTRFRREMNDKDNSANNCALDGLLNYETVKYFTADKHEIDRYSNSLTEYFRASVQNTNSLALLNIGQGLIIGLGMTVSMCLAARSVARGDMSVGDLVAINAYIIQLYSPLSWLGSSYRMIITSFTDLEKLFELQSEPYEVADAPYAEELILRRGEVEFENVTFSYSSRAALESEDKKDKKDKTKGKKSKTKDKEELKKSTGLVEIRKSEAPTLKGVSFKIPGGKTLAIVGPSGSGKTTVSRLLCRFYDPQGGCVRIDGQDIRGVTQQSLRSKIGVVPQDTMLFNDTIGYNIAYGAVGQAHPKVSLDEAAKAANIHRFIAEKTEQGYDTRVGERGLRLSGGEKQRVAIARTFLKDPPILILDEATSALDSRTEKEIQASLLEVSKGRTTLIIAHRLSTIVNADEIIVLKAGEIVERGTHRELLVKRGEYATMWDFQSRESDNVALSEESGDE